MKTVLVYGGAGALGLALVGAMKAEGYAVISVDLVASSATNHNVKVDAKAGLAEQGAAIVRDVQALLASLETPKLAAVLNAAGGWAGGNAGSAELLANADLMLRQSLYSSMVAAHVAAQLLDDGGLVVLVGAKAATAGTPGMVAYGAAKAAVHQLAASLSAPGSGLSTGSRALALLPVTLDTPMNRKFMADADRSTWTPCDEIARKLVAWVSGREAVPEAPTSLIAVETAAHATTWTAM